MTTLLHATCIEIDGHGVLLRGRSGSGKSDLALRLIDSGAVLVSDDQVRVEAGDGRLCASAPPAIAGLLEVRGLGLVRLPYRQAVALALVVDLVPPDGVERLPEDASVELEGGRLPLVWLAPFEASAPAKVRLAVRRATGDIISAND
jgi:HPr kinase/phosphorylase